MQPAIATDELTKRYGSGDAVVEAVSKLSLTVESGEVFGFLGPNGAGKSTTINMLLDYVRPTDGSATVLGMDVTHDPAGIRRRIGVLPEGFGLYDRLTGWRHLEFAIDWTDGTDDPEAILERVGLSEGDARRPVGAYSTGMKQRLALGMALVDDPDLLILDEPSSGLDPNGIRLLRDIVRTEADRGTTVFFSSHILGQVAAVCDRVGILRDGKLVAVDTIDGLRRTVATGSQLQLRVGEPVTVDLSTIEGVDAVTQEGNTLRITCTDSRAKAEAVIRLADHGVEIHDIDVADASLEDVFTAYTNDGHRPTEPGDDTPVSPEVSR